MQQKFQDVMANRMGLVWDDSNNDAMIRLQITVLRHKVLQMMPQALQEARDKKKEYHANELYMLAFV